MVWSNWRGAVVVMSAWVGLAWSQAPAPTTPAGQCERIMTVHENGKSIRCRIVATWRTPEGSQAYRLQALDSGETITIVEDGPAASVEEPTLAGKVKALPMRIFHWGRNRVTPPGVPESPEPVTASEPIVLDAPKMEASPTCAPGCAPGCPVVTTQTIGKEQTVWWEEKNGQRVSPMIVTEGKNPFEQPSIHTMPATGAPPIIAEHNNTPPASAGVPIVVDSPTPATTPKADVVITTSPSKSGVGGEPPISSTIAAEPALSTAPPAPNHPIVTAAPAAPVPTSPVPKEVPEVKSPAPRNLPGTNTLNIAEGQAPPHSVAATPTAIGADRSFSQSTQTVPTFLPNVPQMPRTDPMVAAQPGNSANTANAYPTTAAAAASTTLPAPAPAVPARTTLADRIHNLLHPKRETSVVAPPETKQAAAGAPRTDTPVAAAPPGTPVSRVPFSTAADSSVTATAAPPPAPTNVPAIPSANRSTPPTATTGGLPAAAQNNGDTSTGQATGNPPAPPPTPSVVKKDWRTMWGQPKEAKAQLPGQSLVDQASAKPNRAGIPSLDNPPATGHMPPTSVVNNQTADILLAPEKFDPAGSRLIPKGINMSSYHGDPASLMTKASPPAAAQPVAQSGPDQVPLLQTTAMQAPPLPGKDARVPLGAQSIAAANGNAAAGPVYMPAPPINVPDPYRVPAPPAPRLPDPVQPNAYANAFTPAPPPPNAMTANAFSNINVQPNPTQVARNIPQAPTGRANDLPVAYQPNPMAQGYPVAPGYPPNPNVMMAQGMPNPYYYGAQGQMRPPPLPAPAPPVAAAKSIQQYAAPQFPNTATPDARQGIQPTQYSQPSAPPSGANVAMDRRTPSAPGASNAELAQVLKVLRESPYPAQREWASNTLGTYDWRTHPEVVQLLLQAAQQDPAATVRASCVYSLGRMNAASEPVISTLYMLRNDGDPRVRQEVEQALIRLKN